MRDLHELGLEGTGAAPPEAVAALEGRLGVAFPAAYRQLVLMVDEAVPEVGSFQYEGGRTAISEFFRASDDASHPYSVASYSTAGVPGLPSRVIPIARDANDYLICLDYRGSSEPSVVVFSPSDGELQVAASSFEEFIDGLQA